MDKVERAYRQSCNFLTNMRKTCLYLFSRFEGQAQLDSTYVRGRYRRWGTIGFVFSNFTFEEGVEIVSWMWDQFSDKKHSFYRYTFDREDDGRIRLSIFIAPHRVLKELLFKRGEDQLSLAEFLNRVNNIDHDKLRNNTEYSFNHPRKGV